MRRVQMLLVIILSLSAFSSPTQVSAQGVATGIVDEYWTVPEDAFMNMQPHGSTTLGFTLSLSNDSNVRQFQLTT